MTSLSITESDLRDAKGKVVIVTGGSSGIGLATVELFSSLGSLVINADVTDPPPSLLSLPNTTFHKTNVASWSNLISLFSTVYEKHGRIDVLIANAGVGELEDVLKEEEDGKLKEPSWIVMDVNLIGCLNSVKIAVHYMRKTGGGSIVMTASAAAYGTAAIPVYAAAKHGVLGFMRGTHKSLRADNITINCVAPFFTESALMYPELRARVVSHNIPISNASSVGKALAYCAVKGKEWTGKCVYIAADKFVEVEEKLQGLRSVWLGEEFYELYTRLEE